MAPYNTTQFLLEDREKRVTGDSDGDSFASTAANQQRRSPAHDRYPHFISFAEDSESQPR